MNVTRYYLMAFYWHDHLLGLRLPVEADKMPQWAQWALAFAIYVWCPFSAYRLARAALRAAGLKIKP